MLEPHRMIPAEAQEQNQIVIEHLSHFYATPAQQQEDQASLARIRARLLQSMAVSRTSQSALEDKQISPIPFPASVPAQTFPHRISRADTSRSRGKRRPRYAFLTDMAAAVLVLALVSSFVLAFYLLRQEVPASPRLPATAHGWNLVATFRGTGTQTIRGQDIALGHRFGWLLLCTNNSSGEVEITLNGDSKTGRAESCAEMPSGPLGPEVSSISSIALAPIHTITVTTTSSSSIAWELLLFRGIYYPPLSIDTAIWHPLQREMDGTGSQVTAVTLAMPKVFALEYVCHGTGTYAISILVDPQSTAMGPTQTSEPWTQTNGPCDGQLHLDMSDNSSDFTTTSSGMTIGQVDITTGAENDWQVVLLGCANGKPSCGISTIL